MRLEEERPTAPPTARFVPRNLESLGLADLKTYIDELREEIARAEADIVKKGRSRDAAEAFFKFKE